MGTLGPKRSPAVEPWNSRNPFRITPPRDQHKPVQLNPQRLLTGAIILCCLLVGIAGGTSVEPTRATSAEASSGAGPNTPKSELRQLREPNTTPTQTALSATLSANGSGIWTVSYRFDLSSANETAAFEQLQTDISSNSSLYRERFQQRMAEVSAAAESTTGREMSVTDVRVHASRNGSSGIVTYEFLWRNFAATSDNRLRVDGVLAGLSLDDSTRLTVHWPASYEVATLQPDPTEQQPNAATWTGAVNFTESGIVVEVIDSNPAANTTSGGAEGGPSDGTATENGLPLANIGLVAFVLLVGGLALVLGVRRWRTEGFTAGAKKRKDPGRASSEPSSEDTTTHLDSGTQQPADEGADSEPDLELLSNEEQVLAVLERAGGRAKQQHIVNELGWTDAKTSSVVSQLRDEGAVDGFRLGRENVLSLPDDAGDTTEENLEGE
ncbi:DUF4897 domain-containing protein [Halococcus sp. IIIV-5B]|uniref:DUF4897 domain-containing protein n=1 Tax=Halococcus sp. IIIV-5B TaxID=2321230 RepID=UPI0031840680